MIKLDDIINILIAAIPGVAALIYTHKNQVNLEKLRSFLADEKAERDALRDYKYEARKRLYEEIEPLLFQLNEACENALHRIYSIARTARAGDLGEDGWLSREGYYALSTMYKLILPVTIIKLIQRKLTLVDLSVDPGINAQYLLAKGLYLSFTDDFDFAGLKPSLPYDPNRKDWLEKRPSHPEKYWRQGVPLGRLDNAADALVKDEERGQWISFGEFQAAYKAKTPEVHEKFDSIASIILHFHPQTRPVLWRLLIAQAHIYEALLRSRKMQMSATDQHAEPLLVLIPSESRGKFDWRRSEEEATDSEVLRTPFEVAEQYLHKCLAEFVRSPTRKLDTGA